MSSLKSIAYALATLLVALGVGAAEPQESDPGEPGDEPAQEVSAEAEAGNTEPVSAAR